MQELKSGGGRAFSSVEELFEDAAVLTDALEDTRRLIAHDLLRAREAASLTQTELAQRAGVSRRFVSEAERGRRRAGERYVARVLKACGLPNGWRPAERPGEAAPGGQDSR